MDYSNRSDIVDFLVDNHHYFRSKLAPIRKLYRYLLGSEDPVFHPAIKSDAVQNICSEITQEVARNLAVNPIDVMIVLEDIDLGIYLTDCVSTHDGIHRNSPDEA